MPQPQFMGSVEAAQVLQIDRSTLNRLISAGKIRTIGRASTAQQGAHLFSRRYIEQLATSRANAKAKADPKDAPERTPV